MLHFVANVVQGFNISNSKTHVAVLLFNTKTTIHTELTAETKTFKDIIWRRQYLQPEGLTFTHLALNKAEAIFTRGSRNRTCGKALVLLTDSSCNGIKICPKSVENVAQRLNDRGINIFSVALSKKSVEEMAVVASQPGSKYIRVNQFLYLKNSGFASDVINLICKGILFICFYEFNPIKHKSKTTLIFIRYQYLSNNSCCLDVNRAKR